MVEYILHEVLGYIIVRVIHTCYHSTPELKVVLEVQSQPGRHETCLYKLEIFFTI